MNYQELLHFAKKKLLAKGKEEVDARHLLFFLMNWTSKDYLERGKEQVPAETESSFFALLERRCNGEPVQHITKNQSFYGYDFEVNEDVLTPRPETERLVEMALREMNGMSEPRIMDLCTGSGCIAITIVKEKEDAQVTAVDISAKALEVAKRNADHNRAKEIRWIQSDLFAKLENEQFEMIISNPPYIPEEEIAGLDIEVRKYDPISALVGGKDGLDFYRLISANAGKYLVAGGKLLLEIGHGQAEAVCSMLKKDGWMDCFAYKDYAGKERIVTARKGILQKEK